MSELLQAMVGIGRERLRKPITINVYSQIHWKECIKPHFNVRWNKLKDVLPGTAHLGLVKKFIKESWSKETAQFHVVLEKEVNDMYAANLEAYLTSTPKPHSVCEYHEAMTDAPNTLIPFADAVAQRFGMSVTILMVSPLNDGKVAVRR